MCQAISAARVEERQAVDSTVSMLERYRQKNDRKEWKRVILKMDERERMTWPALCSCLTADSHATSDNDDHGDNNDRHTCKIHEQPLHVSCRELEHWHIWYIPSHIKILTTGSQRPYARRHIESACDRNHTAAAKKTVGKRVHDVEATAHKEVSMSGYVLLLTLTILPGVLVAGLRAQKTAAGISVYFNMNASR